MTSKRSTALWAAYAGFLAPVALASPARAQTATATDTVPPILAPRTPIPPEGATAGVRRFSFIAYGDTRGRHDGVELQAEHQLVIEAMLNTIKRARTSADSIRFVLQSGDAVVNGSFAKMWSVSYVPLVNRLTQEGGVPYFLSVGNHDVGNSTDPADARRLAGLRNYFAANAKLLPAKGARRLDGYPVYAFGYGNTYVMAVDSHIPDDSVQLAWMTRQLESLDRRRYENVVVFFHHPVFSSGPHAVVTESQVVSIRARWMPLFRKHHVRLLLTGHEHLFEHWVERYRDAGGTHRIDEIVSGGGGAPLYGYMGEPDVRDYLAAGKPDSVTLEHLVRPAVDPGGNPFHFVVVHVDGTRIDVEVVAADWGRGFAPYRSRGAALNDPAR
ncbi:MAG: metallophosphoesterase [Gemmatimonadetes bacterium]|nr:metallophosphoesterase [Gemmatimonadota bacterium]